MLRTQTNIEIIGLIYVNIELLLLYYLH